MKLAGIAVVIGFCALSATGSAAAADGKAVFEKSCAGCHKALSPKLSEKDKWKPILARGADAMTASVVRGKGTMPPKGGAANEADARAAVEYLQTLVK